MKFDRRRFPLLLMIGAGLLLAACSGDDPTPTATTAVSLSPTSEPTASTPAEATPANTPTAAPAPASTPALTVTPTPTPAPDVFVLHIEQPVEAETISGTASVTIVGRTRADAAITVNDAFLTPDIDGIFSTELTLVEGVNVIEVVASIASGEELSEVLTILYLP